MTVVNETRYVMDVLISLESIAKHEGVFGDFSFSFEPLDNVYVKSRRCFDMNVILKCFVKNRFEMRAFRAIAIVIFAFVIMALDRL